MLLSLLIATFFMIPTMHALYYYAWGKQLDWSYFDGPPMIAYFFHISQVLFGNTYFSINIVGFLCYTLGAYYIYKIGCLFNNRHTGLISVLIWATLPRVVESVFIRVTYDAPLNLLTVMSFYYFSRYMIQQSASDLYRTAFCIAGMILSKFTALVSILGLLWYVLSRNRAVFKTTHFYVCSLLIIIMIAPMLYWNVQHHWTTIFYLLNYHSLTSYKISMFQSFFKLIGDLLANYSVFLVLAFMGWFKYKTAVKRTHKTNPFFEFNATVLFVSLAFWFITIIFGGAPRTIYFTPIAINIALMAGYTIDEYQYQRLFQCIFPLFLLVTVGMIIGDMPPLSTYLKKDLMYSLTQDATHQPGLFKKGQAIVTGSYGSAAVLSFFIPEQPIYALPCGASNQYQYWSEDFLKTISAKSAQPVTYVDFEDTKQCAESFLKNCKPIATLSKSKTIPLINKQTNSVYLYFYRCH
ncbi:MAG: glycosyltransferase family 39 protein [Legionellaceae bacterium]|nr:glycosyltransferase family 39 protein [Legionellaceae bacterium]